MDDFAIWMEQRFCLDPYLPLAAEKSMIPSSYWKTHKLTFENGKYTVPYQAHLANEENIVVTYHYIDTIYDVVKNSTSSDYFHNHDFYEINYIYRGEVINYLPDQIVHQNHSQVLIMNPMAYHRPIIQSPDTSLFNILIRKDFSSDILHSGAFTNASLINVFLDTSLGLTPMQPYLIFDNSLEITFLLHQMIREYYDRKPYSHQILYADLMRLWSLFARQKNDPEQQSNQKQCPEEVTRILSFLRLHYATATLSDTAKEFGFSSSYLSRYIQKHTGMKYNEIITRLKLQNAAGYLLHTNFSLEKIVDLVGYNDTNYFMKAFKKHFGIAPGQYRNQQR